MALTKASSCRPALFSKMLAGTIPFLIVLETRAPTRTAPKNSKRAAAMVACRIVNDFEATAVANALATSLAPETRETKEELLAFCVPRKRQRE